MINNERGSSLLTVMLLFLIFSVLGLAILSASIGGAKSTSIREDEVISNLDAIKAINEGVAFIKASVNSKYDSETTVQQYQEDIIEPILDKEDIYTIRDISHFPEYNIGDAGYTKVLEVSAEYSPGKMYKQRVYITTMPSFLKYALGSDKHLTMNGSINIKSGNLFAKKGLYLSDEARYVLGVPRTIKTKLSIVDSKSIIELYGPARLCKLTSCYSTDFQTGIPKESWRQLETEDLSEGFEIAPKVYFPNEKFIEVDIPKTFLDKLAEQGIRAHYSEGKMTITDIPPNVSIVNETFEASEIDKTYLVQRDTVVLEPNTSTNLNTKNLFKLNKKNWLIIDGNALLENIGTQKLNIQANILVTGNLMIRGDVSFDSTVYVLGNTDVIDANISGFKWQEGTNQKIGELILMNEKVLTIAKINKFQKSTDLSVYELNAYFYTASDAELYAVGSLVSITGGLFAKGNLEVNSFRGSSEYGLDDLSFSPSNNINDSRLIISNDKTLFLNHSNGFPRVDQLYIITDPLEKD